MHRAQWASAAAWGPVLLQAGRVALQVSHRDHQRQRDHRALPAREGIQALPPAATAALAATLLAAAALRLPVFLCGAAAGIRGCCIRRGKLQIEALVHVLPHLQQQ